MAAYANLVQETTTTTGTGTYSLGGAVAPNRTFVKGVGDGVETVYVVADGSGIYEVARGTVTAGSPATLSRTAIIESVSTPGGDVGTSAIDWGSGNRTITHGLPANRAIAQSPDGTSTVNLRAPLAAIDALTPAADRMVYYTSTSAAALLACTSYGRSLVNAADAAALRTLAGTVIGTDVQAYDADLAAIAALSSAANKAPYATGSGTWALADYTASGRALTAVSSIALGDLIHGSAADTVAKLAGNTTTTKKFLRMTGTGSAAAAPAWDTLVDGDIPSALTGKTYNGLTISTSTGTLTIPSGATFATSGAYSLTLTVTTATDVTLPATGTLSTLAGSETLTNKTVTSPTVDGSIARLTSTNTMIGDTISPQSITGQTPRVQVSGTDTATASIGIIRWSATTNAPAFFFGKSRSDTPGTQAAVQNNDGLGTIVWGASDGTGFVRAAAIEARVSGTPGTNDMPTKLDFFTVPDGSVTQALGLSISSTQSVTVANSLIAGTAAVTVVDATGHIGMKSYTVGTVPSAAGDARLIYVSNETGGATPAFSDGTNWRRVTDRAIVS